jgi:dTDP-4-dehydrorhamnose 3,5-epimerase
MTRLTTNFVEKLIAASGELQVMVPECEKGIGNVILLPEAPTLIDGVKVKSVSVWPDDRGYFLEILRTGQGLPAQFDLTHTQVSAAIKAFHYHQHQTDCWMAVAGMLQVALVDLRYGSRTFGVRNTMYVGALRPWQILIPPGVAYGYKVISLDPSILVYATDQYYNPADEGRIPHNHPSIAYGWELEHK